MSRIGLLSFLFIFSISVHAKKNTFSISDSSIGDLKTHVLTNSVTGDCSMFNIVILT